MTTIFSLFTPLTIPHLKLMLNFLPCSRSKTSASLLRIHQVPLIQQRQYTQFHFPSQCLPSYLIVIYVLELILPFSAPLIILIYHPLPQHIQLLLLNWVFQ